MLNQKGARKGASGALLRCPIPQCITLPYYMCHWESCRTWAINTRARHELHIYWQAWIEWTICTLQSKVKFSNMKSKLNYSFSNSCIWYHNFSYIPGNISVQLGILTGSPGCTKKIIVFIMMKCGKYDETCDTKEPYSANISRNIFLDLLKFQQFQMILCVL